MVAIKNLLPFLDSAFSGIEYAAAALRAEELGFDRSTAFWPVVFPKDTCFGMAWSDDPELVDGIEPPPDLMPGWKLDPLYADRVRYWNGEEWDLVAAPAPGNLDLYKRHCSRRGARRGSGVGDDSPGQLEGAGPDHGDAQG